MNEWGRYGPVSKLPVSGISVLLVNRPEVFLCQTKLHFLLIQRKFCWSRSYIALHTVVFSFVIHIMRSAIFLQMQCPSLNVNCVHESTGCKQIWICHFVNPQGKMNGDSWIGRVDNSSTARENWLVVSWPVLDLNKEFLIVFLVPLTKWCI